MTDPRPDPGTDDPRQAAPPVPTVAFWLDEVHEAQTRRPRPPVGEPGPGRHGDRAPHPAPTRTPPAPSGTKPPEPTMWIDLTALTDVRPDPAAPPPPPGRPAPPVPDLPPGSRDGPPAGPPSEPADSRPGPAAAVPARMPALLARMPSLARQHLRTGRGRRADLVLLGALAVVTVAVVALLVGTLGAGGSARSRAAAPAVRASSAGAGAATVAVRPVYAAASSTQKSDGSVTYGIANALDGAPDTAWNSDGDRDGPGPGITLTFRFATATQLREVSMLDGYQKVLRDSDGRPVDLWRLNARIHRVLVITDTGRWTWTLADVRTPQTLRENLGRTRTVRLRILSVYRSTRYNDVAVSELSFRAAA